MANHVDIESVNILIKAVQEYQNDLDINQKLLLNAANVCDVAMGSDDIAKKHIGRLYEALNELKKTSQIAVAVAEELINDRNRLIDIYED